jgi:hypothetical protein
LDPISIKTDERYRDLLTSISFPDHPLTRWEGNKNPPSPRAWSLRNFKEYGEQIGFYETIRSHYNVALKYLRMTAQDKLEARNLVLPVAPIPIQGINRDAKGPQFTFSEGPPFPFVWIEMVAHLSNTLRGDQTQTDMELVVGQGILSCECRKDPIMYDHKCYQIMSKEKKREMKANGTVATTWDFVFRRVDGSECALHPDFLKNRITYREVRRADDEEGLDWLFRRQPRQRRQDPQVPNAGPGNSDGPGTFQRMIRQTEDKVLQWDIGSFVK